MRSLHIAGILPLFLLGSISIGISPEALAQGGDTCSAPTSITGTPGIFYSNQANTTSGFTGNGGCGGLGVYKDQFFEWTAPSPGRYRFHAVGDYNTVSLAEIALHRGSGCAAVCFDRGADDGSLGKWAYFTARQSGEVVLVQVGGVRGGPNPPPFKLDISRLTGDTCEGPIDIAGPLTRSWRIYGYSSSGFSGSTPCPGAPAFTRDRFFRWTSPQNGSFQFAADSGNNGSIRTLLAAYAGPDCNAPCVESAESAAHNGATAEFALSVQAGETYLLQVSNRYAFFGGVGSLRVSADPANGQSLGLAYCTPGIINTTGGPGLIQAYGNPVASSNDFALVASQLPPGEFGYFIGSRTQAYVLWPGGSRGALCLGGAIARFHGSLGAASQNGYLAYELDLTGIPEPHNFQTSVLAGETWNFQLWHRDNLFGPASNFTEAVSVTFQ